jgi:putative ABC transport system permease protein
MLIKLAIRNILRQKVRTAMTLAAVMFGVAGLILAGGFVKDIFIQLGEAIIHSQTGHIQIFKQGFLEKGTRSPQNYLIEDPDLLAADIAKRPEVDAVMSRLYFSGLLNNGHRDLAIIGEGVEPDKEAKLGSFITIASGRQLRNDDQSGILLGQGVAHSLGLKPGDWVTLVISTGDGAMNTLDFTVVGIFQSFSKDFDARAVRIPLAAAQELLTTPDANLIVVSLKKTDDTDSLLSALRSHYSGSAYQLKGWREISDFYDKAVELYKRQFGVLQLIVLIMVLLSVTNSVNMTVFERQGEFGTMRAMGNRSIDVSRLIVTESTLLGLTGAAGGVILGVAVASAISAIGIPMPPPPNANLGYTAYIRIVPLNLVMAFMVGLIGTTLASLLPARKVARIEIVDALRQNI